MCLGVYVTQSGYTQPWPVSPVGCLTHFSKNGRRLTQGNGNLKIVSLTWFQSDDQVNPTRFPTAGKSNHDSIFVGLYS